MRLTEERKQWRKDHPFVRLLDQRDWPSSSLGRNAILSRPEAEIGDLTQGFYARPRKEGDSLNLLVWDVGIPGKEKVSDAFPCVVYGIRAELYTTDSLGGRCLQGRDDFP